MFHTCFVINHNIWIMTLQFLNLSLHKTIYKAIAALSLRSPHYHQIIIVFFCNCIGKTHFQISLFCHTCRNLISWVYACTFNLFSQLPKCDLRLNTEHFVQICIRICIHRQDRTFSAFT